MPEETYKERLLRRIRMAEAQLAAMKSLPKAARLYDELDLEELKGKKRAHGDRSKRRWALDFENDVIRWVKILKRHFAADDVPTFEAWERARKQIGQIIGKSPATIEDWQRGAARRRRKRSKG